MPAATTVAILALAFAAKRPPPSGGGGFGAPKKGGGGNKAARGFGTPAKNNNKDAGGGGGRKQQRPTKNSAPDEDAPGAYAGGWDELARAPPIAPSGNAPYNTERLILKSRKPLLDASTCASLISQMEAHGAANGWDSRYPVGSYTREVKIADIPESIAVLNEALTSTLLPAAAAEFPTFPLSSLRVNEALVVKYDAASGHNCLPVHQDFSLLTINVALTESSAFDGGGTWFQHSGETVVASLGEVVMHAGGVPHCGVPVSRGARYQLVLFLLGTTFPDVCGRLKAIGAASGAKAGSALMDLKLSGETLTRSLDINRFDAEGWSQLGHNCKRKGDMSAAADAFEAVRRLSGDRDFAALCDLAEVRSAQRRHDDALAALQRALAVGAPPSPSMVSDMSRATHRAGMALMALRRFEDAGLVFESVLDSQPDAVDSWAALGMCMAELGQPEAARACEQRVSELTTQTAMRGVGGGGEDDGGGGGVT